MGLRFRGVLLCAIPGALALLGCWWVYCHRKKHASYDSNQAIAVEEEEREEVPENDPSPKAEACVPQTLPLPLEEECPENETSTSLLSAVSTPPSLLCPSHEGLDLSQDLPNLSVATVQPGTLEDDSEEPERIGCQAESSVPACVSLPLISESTECPGSLTDSCLSSPVQGERESCRLKNHVCNESQGVGGTPVENQGGSLGKLPFAMEDCGYSADASEGGTSAEDPLQNATLSVASGRHSDSLSVSATQDRCGEQSSAPADKAPTVKVPEDSKVPYSNGILKEDGPDLPNERSSALGVDGDHTEGGDVNSVDFVESGCAMRKTVTCQNSRLGGESSKSDFVVWEIEVPKE